MLGQHVLILVGMVSEDVLELVITRHDQTEVVIVWVIGFVRRNLKTTIVLTSVLSQIIVVIST